MYPHRIRLRGPWECQPLARIPQHAEGCGEADTEPLPARCRMTMPCRWGDAGLEGFAGRVRFHRHFSRPGRIDPHERVWLTFAGVEGSAEISLNERLLGRHVEAAAPFEFEVTPWLRLRNDLTVDVTAATDRGGLWGEVALEVRCSAYLHGVRWWLVDTGEGVRLHVAGAVVGTSDRPLELYALLDNHTVLYTSLEAEPEGKAFRLVSEEVHVKDRALPYGVRIELVNGASVWYGLEGTVELHAEPCP
jgi:hypothetical protein